MEFEFIDQEISESRLYRSSGNMRQLTGRDVADLLYLNTIALYLMVQDDVQHRYASNYAKQTTQYGSYNTFRTSATDLYLLGYMLNQNQLQSWQSLKPAISNYLKTSQAALYILILIFCITAAFSILNTLLMATLERQQEYGMMRALGTPKRLIVALVLCEASFMSAMGSFFGFIISISLYYFYLAPYGINIGQNNFVLVFTADETSFRQKINRALNSRHEKIKFFEIVKVK